MLPTVPSTIQFPWSLLPLVTHQLHCLVLLLLHQDEHRIEPVCSCLLVLELIYTPKKLELIYQAMHCYGGIILLLCIYNLSEV